MYKTEVFGLLMRLSLKGIVYAIQNVFIKKEKHFSSIANYKLRTPRNFYGKYKYIKSFNDETAKIQDNIMKNYSKYPFLKGHHFVDGITLEHKTFLFTTIGMFVFDKNLSHIVEYQVDYFCIQDVDWNSPQETIVNIFFTQEIDNKYMITIETNEHGGGKVIGKMLLCYYNIYKDELNNLD